MNITDIRSRAPRHRTKRIIRRPLSAIRKIVIHHGATRRGLGGTNYEAHLRYHVYTNNWSCGGYSYGVEPNGEIKWGYDWTIQTPHVGNANRHSLGIVLPGDFRHEKPTDIQWRRALELVSYIKNKLPNRVRVVGHHEVSGYEWKECPAFSMNRFRIDLKKLGKGAKYMWPTSPTLRKCYETQLERAIKRGIIDQQWLQRYKKGTLDQSDAIALNMLIFSAEPSRQVYDVHAKAWNKAMKKGVLNGEKPNHPLTRSEFATAANRLGLLD